MNIHICNTCKLNFHQTDKYENQNSEFLRGRREKRNYGGIHGNFNHSYNTLFLKNKI